MVATPIGNMGDLSTRAAAALGAADVVACEDTRHSRKLFTVTGLPALNSIRAVVAAPPGIVTSADLPLRAFAGRFARA